MVCGGKGMVASLVVLGVLIAADASAQSTVPAANERANPDAPAAPGAADPARPSLSRANGMVVLDYQVIPVPQEESLDLMGLHALTQLTDWMYLGVGAYAPLFKGAYGGFMGFDVTAHAQRKIWGNLFADAGLSVGGGGGGRSKQQSKILSGTGGFYKAYVGLGYDFTDFSVGANVARVKFNQSAIDHTQLNMFVQVPFSYAIGPYARSGEGLAAADAPAFFDDSSETTLTWGLDNFVQIDPKGTNTSRIRLVDLQVAHYLTSRTYWYANLAVGYHGSPLYNQIVGGLGYRIPVSPRVHLHGQLGVGSGGYAPEEIDTGSGLLVYPKVAAEYAISKNLGVLVSAGYLFAPKGSSKNYTFGAAISYHFRPDRDASGARGGSDSIVYRGYRFSLFPQSDINVRYRDIERPRINLLATQIDTIVSDHIYIPIKGAVAYNAYLDYPGYGELLAGIGIQSQYRDGDRFQFFGQVLGGANVHGPLLQAGVGVNVGLSDRLALYASAGKTRASSSKDGHFSADYLGLGVTYRFSVPN